MEIISSNLTIHVTNLQRAITFYQSIGFTVKQVWEPHYAQLEAPNLTIGLHPSKNKAPDSGNLSIGFEVQDLELNKSELQKLSISFEARQDEGGSFLHFADPDGTKLYFVKTNW